MVQVIIGIIAVCLFVTVVIPLVTAVASIALAVVVAAAFLVGAFFAIKNYAIAISKNLNFVHWVWEKGDEPARRSYFFGPGYLQLRDTVCEAFRLLGDSALRIKSWADKMNAGFDSVLEGAMTVGGFIFKVCGYICVYGIGTLLGAALALIHGSVTTLVMVGTYVIFTIVWLIDRLYLLKNKITTICPICKERSTIPVFECSCGRKHRRLIPGPYGIWHHRCECGKKLPSTFLNGRSSLVASCPHCDSNVVASDARPVVFQLVGGIKSGKTVYLSAFFHEFMKKIRSNNGLEVTVTEEYQPLFDELEDWYSGSYCPATTQLNSQMYPMMISGLGVKRQFSIFDIAGEMFDGIAADGELAQHQFTYCDGLLFMIDPFSNGVLRMNRETANQDISDFSDMPVESVAANFINYMIRVGHAKANARCSIPLAVLITKADIREVRRVIGPAKIKSIMTKEPDRYATLEEARDSVCRQFLIDIGMASAVNDLETQFSNIHYYPVSAQGHSSDGTEFEPWGIMEAIDWMLPLADKELANVVSPKLIENT